MGQLDLNDPTLAAAVKACGSVLPAGPNGGGGFGGGGFGGGGFGAIRDCLAKKKIVFDPAQAGANGQPDEKTLKAIQECRAEAATSAPPTTKK